MNPLATLSALSRGDPAAAAGILPAARAQAFGAEAFGPAAIVELFARAPCPVSSTPAAVESARALSLLDADAEGREQAWFADLHDGRVARLWRVGGGDTDAAAEPAPPVAADVFLTQAREPAAFRAEDHPDLEADAARAVLALAAHAALGPDEARPAAQGRAFVVRALVASGQGGALLWVAGLPGGAPRWAASGFRHVEGELVHARLVWDAERAVSVLRGLVPFPPTVEEADACPSA